MKPYDEAEHRALSARLKREQVSCWRGCQRRATTVDHVPALSRHCHRAGTRCCELRPACARCNYSTGSRLARRSTRSSPVSRAWYAVVDDAMPPPDPALGAVVFGTVVLIVMVLTGWARVW